MKLYVFASGSSGNCALLENRGTHVLIDVGISFRALRSALAALGLSAGQLDGVLVTHTHSDHIGGLPQLAGHCPVPVWVSDEAARDLRRRDQVPEESLRVLRPGTAFSVGATEISAFPTSHDAEGSVGFVLRGEEGALGFCTDTGCCTEAMIRSLAGCRTALLESNHDEDLLRAGRYPFYLKRRILSESGHLSNTGCAELAVSLAGHGLRSLVLGHLSRENNRPEIAYETARRALDSAGFPSVDVQVAPAAGCLLVEV